MRRRLNALQFILQSSAFPFLPGLLKLSNWLQVPLHISVVKIYHSVCGRKQTEEKNIKFHILCHSNLRHLACCHIASLMYLLIPVVKGILNPGHPCSLSLCTASESEVAQSCPTLMTPRTVAYQVPPSLGFSRQEYWSGLPFPSAGDLPNPGIEPGSPAL